MKPCPRYALAVAALALVSLLADCGGDGGASVVSCDILVGSPQVHYCEEYPPTDSLHNSCPQSALQTPGTACSREGVTRTCTHETTVFYFYDPTPTARSIMAVVCSGQPLGNGGAAASRGY
jgi:hypothetical protein